MLVAVSAPVPKRLPRVSFRFLGSSFASLVIDGTGCACEGEEELVVEVEEMTRLEDAMTGRVVEGEADETTVIVSMARVGREFNG